MTTTLLRGGRVVDPGSAIDQVADVLVRDGRVAEVAASVARPEGSVVVDVGGLVVGPGFVDLHSHVHTIAGQRLQALDGVTTALDLEAGLAPVERAYAEAAAAGRPLHCGFSASWAAARAKVLLGRDSDASLLSGLAVLAEPGWQRSSSARELAAWLELLRGELAAGALGIGVLLGYAPRTDPQEFLAVARLAADIGVPTYTHVRELVEADPTTPVDGSAEVTLAAAETGAHMHHCHVNSTSRRHVDRVLATVESAVAAGQGDGGGLSVRRRQHQRRSVLPGPGTAGRLGAHPSSLVLLPSGERIADEARLREVRATDPGASCVVEFLDEGDPGRPSAAGARPGLSRLDGGERRHAGVPARRHDRDPRLAAAGGRRDAPAHRRHLCQVAAAHGA